MREAKMARKTKETDIKITLQIDGTGKSSINTGIGFFDHMLTGFAKHGFFDLNVNVEGDILFCPWMMRWCFVPLILAEDPIWIFNAISPQRNAVILKTN